MSVAAPAVAAPPHAGRRRWTRGRIIGIGFLGFWVLLFGGIVWFQVTSFTPEFTARYGPKLLDGFVVTLQLVFLSLAIGVALSLPITAARMASSPLLSVPAYAYVYFFRGTPLLCQAFLVYYGAGTFQPFLKDVGLWWFFRDAFNCAVFTFSLNTSAYQAEILRGAIQNVSPGQVEGARAVGLTRLQALWTVVLPQAMITALRPYGNEVVLMIKGSAIAAIVTVFDLMGETRRAFSRSYDFQTYLWAAVLYLLLVFIVWWVWNGLEARLTRHLRRRND